MNLQTEFSGIEGRDVLHVRTAPSTNVNVMSAQPTAFFTELLAGHEVNIIRQMGIGSTIGICFRTELNKQACESKEA